MKKILHMGLNATATEGGVQSWPSGYGPVCNVGLVREGNAKAPVAIVEMHITDGLASLIVSLISSYWHDGSLVSAH